MFLKFEYLQRSVTLPKSHRDLNILDHPLSLHARTFWWVWESKMYKLRDEFTFHNNLYAVNIKFTKLSDPKLNISAITKNAAQTDYGRRTTTNHLEL